MRRIVKNIFPNEKAAEWVDINELVLWTKNPRHNEKTVAEVIDSIKRFGFGSPILVRRDNNEIIAGHTRVKAAKKLGFEVIPVRYMDLTEKEAHLLALADNKLNESSSWDNDLLRDIMNDYTQADIELAGWDSDPFGLDDVENEVAGDDSDKIVIGYAVVIECKNEEEQIDIILECEKRGWKCRALT